MEELKLACSELIPGMYVCRLDRPWLGTPYLMQGFMIRHPGDIARLSEICQHVYIDVERSDRFEASSIGYAPELKKNGRGTPLVSRMLPAESERSAAAARASERVARASKTGGRSWEASVAAGEELPKARKVLSEATSVTARAFETARQGRRIDLRSVSNQVSDVVDSVLRSPDASILLARLKKKDDYTYNHAMCASVLAAALGKQLNLTKGQLRHLTLGAMLFDIGKVRLPDALLSKPGELTEEEMRELKRHVEYGFEILEDSEATPIVLEIAGQHHERYNGSGYPNGKFGDEIGLYAQIVGLVDTYDAMTSTRVYQSAMSHEAAIQELYETRDSLFSAGLLELFIQCLGTYPAGSLVELTDGSVGIVIEQNLVRRLRPQVMLVLDSDKEPLDDFAIVDLLEELNENPDRPLAIARTLLAGSYGVDPSDYFLD